MVVTNMEAPVSAPRLNLYPFVGSDHTAFMVALTSEAPFPRARSVTPANRGGNPNSELNISNAGLKYSSAVEPNSRKRSVKISKMNGESSIMNCMGDRKEGVRQKTNGKSRPELSSQVCAYWHRLLSVVVVDEVLESEEEEEEEDS